MDVLGYFRTLLDIPSPSWKEDAVSSFIAMTMSSFGYQMIDDRAGNILFFLPVRGEKALISSHMDTVPLAETPHVIEDDAYFMTDGRTALGADNKATIAAMLKVAEESPDALFLFTRAEEIGLQGSKKITRDFLSPFNITRAYVPDAEGPVGTVITSAPGKEVLDIVFHQYPFHRQRVATKYTFTRITDTVFYYSFLQLHLKHRIVPGIYPRTYKIVVVGLGMQAEEQRHEY